MPKYFQIVNRRVADSHRRWYVRVQILSLVMRIGWEETDEYHEMFIDFSSGYWAYRNVVMKFHV